MANLDSNFLRKGTQSPEEGIIPEDGGSFFEALNEELKYIRSLDPKAQQNALESVRRTIEDRFPNINSGASLSELNDGESIVFTTFVIKNVSGRFEVDIIKNWIKGEDGRFRPEYLNKTLIYLAQAAIPDSRIASGTASGQISKGRKGLSPVVVAIAVFALLTTFLSSKFLGRNNAQPDIDSGGASENMPVPPYDEATSLHVEPTFTVTVEPSPTATSAPTEVPIVGPEIIPLTPEEQEFFDNFVPIMREKFENTSIIKETEIAILYILNTEADSTYPGLTLADIEKIAGLMAKGHMPDFGSVNPFKAIIIHSNEYMDFSNVTLGIEQVEQVEGALAFGVPKKIDRNGDGSTKNNDAEFVKLNEVIFGDFLPDELEGMAYGIVVGDETVSVDEYPREYSDGSSIPPLNVIPGKVVRIELYNTIMFFIIPSRVPYVSLKEVLEDPANASTEVSWLPARFNLVTPDDFKINIVTPESQTKD